MSIAALVLQLAVSTMVVTTGEVSYFPGSYFDENARTNLQRRVMETWPGPSGVLELWRSGELDEEQKVAVLLGSAAFHDPKLYPLYSEALGSSSPRLRQAGLYGYRDLIADARPNVRGGVDDKVARLVEREIQMLRWTSYIQPLVAMWLQSLLDAEGLDLPGYRGASLVRRPMQCLRAVEVLMREDDIVLLIRAYRTTGRQETRFSLLRLIEALTFHRFVEIPKGPRAGWGDGVYQSALNQFDAWLEYWVDRRCRISSWRMVREGLEKLGARGVSPTSRDACVVWQLVLKEEYPPWWAVAARRLYECGGPWRELSVLQAESPANRESRDRLLKWYRIQKGKRKPRDVATPTERSPFDRRPDDRRRY